MPVPEDDQRLAGDSTLLILLARTLGELTNVVTRRHPAPLSQAERFLHITGPSCLHLPMEFEDLSDALSSTPSTNSNSGMQSSHRAPCFLARSLLRRYAGRTNFIGGVTIRNPFKMSKSDLDAFVT